MTPIDRLPGVHALRVVAAVTVYLLHVLHLTAPFVERVTQAAGHLVFGVPLFFALSAFSLMYSTRPYEGTPGWVRKFYLKRYFRIAPLFYLMLIVDIVIVSTLSLGAFFPQREWPGWYEILLNLTFVFGLSPQHVSSLVLVGWSVGAEMLFYFTFPLLLVLIRNPWSALAFVVFAHVVGEIARPMLDPLVQLGFMTTLSDLHIVTNLRYFAFGILAFHLFDYLRNTRLADKNAGFVLSTMFHLVCASISGGLIVLVVMYRHPMMSMWHLDMVVWGALFTVLCVWFTVRPLKVLNWTPIQWLGERSYSLYLIHFPVMLLLEPFTGWLFYSLLPLIGWWAIIIAVVLTYVPIVLVSGITYRLVERPGMDIGKAITRRISRPRAEVKPAIATGD